MSDKKVPLGVSVITILMYLGAIMDFALAIFLMIDRQALADASDMSESAILGVGIGLAFIALIIGLLAMGLRSGSNGVRLIIAVVMVLRLGFAIYALFALPEGGRSGAFVTGAIALVVLYLLYGSHEAKAFFGDEPEQPALD